MKIVWERTFDSAHRIYRTESKCRFLHGHTYKVVAIIEGELNEWGMVVDFGILKEKIIDLLDHKVILEKNDPLIPLLKKSNEKIVALSQPPTAENISRLISKIILELPEKIDRVTVEVYETPLQRGISEFSKKDLKNINISFEEINAYIS